MSAAAAGSAAARETGRGVATIQVRGGACRSAAGAAAAAGGLGATFVAAGFGADIRNRARAEAVSAIIVNPLTRQTATINLRMLHLSAVSR
jgi:hypothetical protein